jgi:dihydroxyacetone kinase-like predicted kinase
LNAGEKDIVMLFFGKDVPEEEAEEMKSALEIRYRSAEFYLSNGGQPIYDYIMVLE